MRLRDSHEFGIKPNGGRTDGNLDLAAMGFLKFWSYPLGVVLHFVNFKVN